jgi:hypothetical protein
LVLGRGCRGGLAGVHQLDGRWFFRVNGLSLRPDQGRPAEVLDGYLATLSIFDLVVQVFWPYDPGRGDYLHQRSLAGSIQQIWPVSDSFVWPPGPALTRAGISGISGPDPRPGEGPR